MDGDGCGSRSGCACIRRRQRGVRERVNRRVVGNIRGREHYRGIDDFCRVVPSVHFKSHVITVYEPDGQIQTAGSGTVRRVQLQPASATLAYEQFGVESANPYVLYDDVEAANLYVVHGIVEYNGRTFVVNGDPRVWDIEPSTSHVAVLLTERS